MNERAKCLIKGHLVEKLLPGHMHTSTLTVVADPRESKGSIPRWLVTVRKNLLPDTIVGPQNTPKSIAARVSFLTPLGELTALL